MKFSKQGDKLCFRRDWLIEYNVVSTSLPVDMAKKLACNNRSMIK